MGKPMLEACWYTKHTLNITKGIYCKFNCLILLFQILSYFKAGIKKTFISDNRINTCQKIFVNFYHKILKN